VDKTADCLQRLGPIATAVKAALSGFAVMRILDIADEWGRYATRNAQLAGDAAACRDLADRHEQLASRTAAGAGVVGELVGLVGVQDA
jgi:hypothetical protein